MPVQCAVARRRKRRRHFYRFSTRIARGQCPVALKPRFQLAEHKFITALLINADNVNCCCEAASLVEDAAKVIRDDFMARDPESLDFNVVALCKGD